MCTSWDDGLVQDSDRILVDRYNTFSHHQSRDGLHHVSSSTCGIETWRLINEQDHSPKPYYRRYVGGLVVPCYHLRCRFRFRRCSVVGCHVI